MLFVQHPKDPKGKNLEQDKIRNLLPMKLIEALQTERDSPLCWFLRRTEPFDS